MGRIDNVKIRLGGFILETQSASYREVFDLPYGGRYYRDARTYTGGIGAGGKGTESRWYVPSLSFVELRRLTGST